MTASRDIAARLREAMEGVTPTGQWTYQEQSDAYTHIVRGPDNCFVLQLSQDTTGVIERRARWLALCSPENIKILLDYIDSLRNEIDLLKDLNQ